LREYNTSLNVKMAFTPLNPFGASLPFLSRPGDAAKADAAAFGDAWKSEIYFDPEADSHFGQVYRIGDGELIRMMKELIKGREQITTVSAYQYTGGICAQRQ